MSTLQSDADGRTTLDCSNGWSYAASEDGRHFTVSRAGLIVVVAVDSAAIWDKLAELAHIGAQNARGHVEPEMYDYRASIAGASK